jgi:FtsP/CotA-like multicopper oxidase with cupredoxin domain
VPVEPTVLPQTDAASPAEPESNGVVGSPLSRRNFLRVAGAAGLTGVAASVAACTSSAVPSWSFGAPAPAASATAAPTESPTQAPTPAPSEAPSASPSPSASPDIPAGWSEHDVASRNVLQRYVGNLVPTLATMYPEVVVNMLGDMWDVGSDYPELSQKPAFAQVPNLVITDAVQPLQYQMDGDVKVFNLTIDEMEWKIDEKMPTVAALGYNAQWPGPTFRVKEGDRVRAIFKNNLNETTSVHFHGQEFEDFTQDGVAFVTQKPFAPGESWTYEFVANRPGSLMYHSHHNATDQVGRGLLGGLVVEPRKPTPDDRFDRDYVWISNDALGGFTINGHGFPATVPVLAAQGETVRVRFMNEGQMMHPWHLHGFRMKVVARDGYDLGSNAFYCDTLGVNPGERFDVNIVADRLGIWAFHCHILPHAEGADGMFGMVSTLIVLPTKADVDTVVQALLA